MLRYFMAKTVKIILKGDKKLKKFITTLCLIFSLIFVISGCSCGGDKDWKVGYAGGAVSSNGGFAVVVGDYTYFINGIEANTAKNTSNAPVKGSLVRIKTNELSQGANAESAEVVVPKIFASTHYGAGKAYQTGLTIFGDYVYYGTPSTEKDKKGNVKNGNIIFQKTKLDGTNTDKIAEFTGMATEYKFVKASDNTVYLIVIETANNVSDITVYSESGDKEFSREGVDSFVLPYDFEGDYLFFTDKVKDEDGQDEAFGAIYSYKLGEAEEKTVINGADSRNGGSAEFGTQGRVFTVRYLTNLEEKEILYFSFTSADSTDGTRAQYAFLTIDQAIKHLTALAEDATDAQKAQFITDNLANFNARTPIGADEYVVKAITATACYKAVNNILYYDADLGIMSYDYTKADRTVAENAPYYGTELVVEKSRIKIDTPSFIEIVDDYAYFADKNNLVYRIKLEDGAKIEQITTVAKASWYTPEIIGGYMLLSLTDEPYNSYVYAFNLSLEADVATIYADQLENLTEGTSEYDEKLDELVEEYLKAISDKEEDAIQSIIDKRIGPMKKADKNAVTSYMTSNYSSTSSN